MSEVANSLWVEKYRPQTLDDYVGNQQLKKTMEKYIEQDDIPSVLLYGKAGTGKCLDFEEEINIEVELSPEEFDKYSEYLFK